MTPRQKVFALAAVIGANVESERDSQGFGIKVDSPDGCHWDGEIHQIYEWQFSGFDTKEL